MLTLHKKRNVIFRIAVIACLLAAVLVSCAEIAVAQHVHLVTVYDSKSNIRESCKQDIDKVTQILIDWWPNRSVTPLTTEIRASGLRQKIASLSVGPDDVLFFYYSGHGRCDALRRHYLSMNYTQNDADELPRTQLREALRAKNARLTILVTDCCADDGLGIAALAPCVPAENLRRLFSASGLVDINSCSPGEIAWCLKGDVHWVTGEVNEGEKGGLFTAKFCDAMRENSDWKVVFASACEGTKREFDDFKKYQSKLNGGPSAQPGAWEARRNWTTLGLKNQVSQTPWKLSLPKETREIGVRISAVFPATTAANLRDEKGRPARLKPNDIIYGVTYGVTGDTEYINIKNNVTHLPDVISRMERNGEIWIKVIDADTGLWKVLTGKLDYGTQARFGVSLRTD